MPPRPVTRQVPRLALNQVEAAAALGLSLASFKRWVAPCIACVYVGSARLYPVRELERWLEVRLLRPSDVERNIRQTRHVA
jgi:hypothetical protein